MPFTVSCPACSARFTLGDDLFRRKVAGNIVTVKCRHCSAEIAVDATEPSTMPSHDVPAPRRAPSPPRPKGASVTKMGLGLPAPALQGATVSPLGLNPVTTPMPLKPSATATPFGGSATATPLGLGVRVKPPPAEDLSIWDSDDTVQINAPEPEPQRAARVPHVPHPPQRPHPPQKSKLEEPELIDAEEIPASSSDAPTLDALTLETGRPKALHGKPKQDDFLVNLSAGTQGILGSAPTIDVSHLDAPLESIEVDEIEDEVEFHAAAPQTARTGTIPLFDMSAVLPAASGAAKTSSNAAPARSETAKPVATSVPAPESKARERKYVVAPKESASAPKGRRTGAAIWFVLVAAAAGVVAVVGLRGHGPAPIATTEPSASSAPPPAVTEAAASTAALPTAEASAASSESAAPTNTAPASAATAIAVATNTLPAPASTHESVAAAPTAEKPATEKPVEPAIEKPEPEKPAAPSKPVEAHNAPPAAAEGTEFDRAAARNALASAAAQASACRKDGDPSGTATLTITFAPSGRVTSAAIQGPPFAGTPTGGCIANTMRHATVPAFSGEYVTVTKSIVVQ